MIHGVIRNLQAQVDVTFRMSGRPDLIIEFVVDTGFSGALTLPIGAVQVLGLPFFQDVQANLANDDGVRTPVHLATVLWDGEEIEVPVLAMGRRPLLGTALLNGKRICADFVEGGIVSIGDNNGNA